MGAAILGAAIWGAAIWGLAGGADIGRAGVGPGAILGAIKAAGSRGAIEPPPGAWERWA
jgi:hypothetical protein